MKQQIKQHISNCMTYFAHKPSKSEAKHSGLSIPMEDLSPMDWLSTDLMEVKDKTGKKSSYLIIVDRASAFVRAYKLTGTKTKNIISSLEEFVEVYYGPPYYSHQMGGYNLVLLIGQSLIGQMTLA